MKEKRQVPSPRTSTEDTSSEVSGISVQNEILSPLPFERDNDFALLTDHQMKVIQYMFCTQHVKSYCQSSTVFPGDL